MDQEDIPTDDYVKVPDPLINQSLINFIMSYNKLPAIFSSGPIFVKTIVVIGFAK